MKNYNFIYNFNNDWSLLVITTEVTYARENDLEFICKLQFSKFILMNPCSFLEA